MELEQLSFFCWSGLKSALITLIAIRLLIPIAHRFKLLDHPSERKKHAISTPLIGGIAIFLGSTFCIVTQTDNGPQNYYFWLIAAVILITGIIDDYKSLKVKTRLLIHSFAVLGAILLTGTQLDYLGTMFSTTPMYLTYFAPIVTIFLILSFINAINMLDGLDGLVAAITIGQLVFLFGYSIALQEPTMSLLLISVLCSVCVFLYYNVPTSSHRHARIFLGDAGSTVLAFFISWMTVSLSQKATTAAIHPIEIFWCVFFPFMEIFSVCVLRRRKRQSIAVAGHDHIHFLLLKKGFSRKMTVLMISACSCFYGALGIILTALNVSDNIQFLMMWFNILAYSLIIIKANSTLIDDQVLTMS